MTSFMNAPLTSILITFSAPIAAPLQQRTLLFGFNNQVTGKYDIFTANGWVILDELQIDEVKTVEIIKNSTINISTLSRLTVFIFGVPLIKNFLQNLREESIFVTKCNAGGSRSKTWQNCVM